MTDETDTGDPVSSGDSSDDGTDQLQRIGGWRELQAAAVNGGFAVTADERARRVALVRKALVDHDPRAREELVSVLEGCYWTFAVHRAPGHVPLPYMSRFARFNAEADVEQASGPGVPAQEVGRRIAIATELDHDEVAAVIGVATRTPLWKVDRTCLPWRVSQWRQSRLDGFDLLVEAVGTYVDAIGVEFHRWGWHDRGLCGREGCELPEQLVVIGVAPAGRLVTVLRCPIDKKQEREVLRWLQGWSMGAAVARRWGPALDHTEG